MNLKQNYLSPCYKKLGSYRQASSMVGDKFYGQPIYHGS